MKQTPWIALSIDRGSSKPVFEQICAAIRTKAVAGELTEGSKLPPTRAFATELGVSRSTIVTAYEQLVAEGYLESLPGSGYRVCALGSVEFDAGTASPKPHAALKPPVVPKPSVAGEGVARPRPFAAGQPDMRLFPQAQWARTLSRVCRTNPESLLVGGSAFGNHELRKAVTDHISEWRGIEASPRQIIITAGAIDALEICLRGLAKPGDRLAVEDPGYPPVCHFAAALGLSPSYLEVGRNGASLPDKDSAARLVVLTPSHQYPLGGAMPASRRLEFIKWSEERDAWIIEDDYDSEFRYAGRPIPAMAGFDRLNRTIYVGSFSKIFSNSLRLGYVVVPEPLVETFAATLSRFGVRASAMPQQALADFIHKGEFYRHLRRVRRIYAERRKHLLIRLASDFHPYGSFVDHQAGMQIAFHLNRDFVDQEVAREAEAEGLTVEALSSFCFDAASVNGLLLGFCGFAEEELDPALDQLERILRRH